MIVKIDVDGVIRDIFTRMCEIYNDMFNTNLKPSDIYDYDVEKVFPKIKQTFNMDASYFFFDANSEEIFFKSKPYLDAKTSIERLINEGHHVVIATWQKTDKNKTDTLNFLKKYKIPYHDICFTRDKWMIKSDVIIDDNPEFILDERDESDRIMINMPFNINTDFSGIRVNNLKEAVDLLLNNDE